MRRRVWAPLRRWTTTGTTAEKRERASSMRDEPTPAEALLWTALRRRSLGGWKFRRQHVIAGFIVDFFCPALRLTVEVDGAVYAERREQDAERDEQLSRLGVWVVHLDNDQVLHRLDAALATLAACCKRAAATVRAPSPSSSPRPAGGGK